MALPNAYAQYKNSKVLTASPAELTLMLYEGAIKFCNIAITAIEQKEVEGTYQHPQSAKDHRASAGNSGYEISGGKGF